MDMKELTKLKPMLTRTSLAVDVVIPKTTRTMAAKAKDLLGYKVMSKAVKRPTVLAKLLRKLEINPFSKASVMAYQEAMCDEVYDQLKKDGKDADNFSIRWKSIAIANYNHPIPEFVLNKAIQIKEENPEVDLKIEELSVKEVPDPFLVAKLDEEEYYVDCWDEKKFEDQLLSESAIEGNSVNDDDEEDEYDDSSDSSDEEDN